MDTQPQTIKTLTSLAYLDADTSQVYQQVINNVVSTVMCNALTDCLRDHEHHFKDSCRMINDLGGTLPDYDTAFKGYINQGYAALMNLRSINSRLNAIRKNEISNIQHYEKALTGNLFPEARRLIEKGLNDEHRHLACIEDALKLENYLTKKDISH
jgi:hypothetical protein